MILRTRGFAVFLLSWFFCWSGFSKTSSQQLITQVPMLMAHDAAMAYAQYGSGNEAGYPCYTFKTQAFRANERFYLLPGQKTSGFTSLLNCGARSFDLRLGVKDACTGGGIGEVCMHHSDLWLEHQTFESELATIVDWSHENPTELILLKLVPDLESDRIPIQASLDVYNIQTVPCPNGEVPSVWTLAHSIEEAQSSGVMVLAVWDECVDDNYIPELSFDPLNKEQSFSALWKYAFDVVLDTYKSGRQFQEVQLMWQSAHTYELYQVAYPKEENTTQPYRYGNLKSTQESGLNQRVLDAISTLKGPALNWVKFNDICLYGPDIARKLGTNVTKSQMQECAAVCGRSNARNTCVDHEI